MEGTDPVTTQILSYQYSVLVVTFTSTKEKQEVKQDIVKDNIMLDI